MDRDTKIAWDRVRHLDCRSATVESWQHIELARALLCLQREVKELKEELVQLRDGAPSNYHNR